MNIACDACVDGVASFYCKTCDVHFCKGCEEIHFKASETTLHGITALFEEDDLMLKSRSPFCKHHPDLALDYFCIINKEAICAICAFKPEHMTVHECRKMTLQEEEARQREILAPGLLYVQKVQTTLEDLEESFKTQLGKDREFISFCQNALKEGDRDKEILSTHLTCLEKNVDLDIETLEVLMWTTNRFVDDFNSIKDLYGYGFITAIKNLHLTTLLEEIRSQESQLPPVRKLNTSTWPKDLRLKLKDLGLQMTTKPTRDYSQINQPIFQFGSDGRGYGQFDIPFCIAISPNEDVFVADYHNHRIQAFDQKGNFLFKFGSNGNGNGQFNHPRGIAFDLKRNRVFVSDGGNNNRIQYFDLKGNFLGLFESKGDQDGQFGCPTGIAIDDDNGDIYVVDLLSKRVQVFDDKLKFLRKFGKKEKGNREMDSPWGIGIFSNGQLVVSECGGKRLSVFEKNGRFVKYIGNGELKNPAHLFVDGNDNILVAEWGNNRIAIFSINGKLIKSVENVSAPHAITINQEGNLFVCERINRISVF